MEKIFHLWIPAGALPRVHHGAGMTLLGQSDPKRRIQAFKILKAKDAKKEGQHLLMLFHHYAIQNI